MSQAQESVFLRIQYLLRNLNELLYFTIYNRLQKKIVWSLITFRKTIDNIYQPFMIQTQQSEKKKRTSVG